MTRYTPQNSTHPARNILEADIDTKSSKSAEIRNPLEIRHLHLEEEIFLTGKALHHNCLVIDRVFKECFVVDQQYFPIDFSVLSMIPDHTTPVLFHEAISMDGEQFAIPQSLDAVNSKMYDYADLFDQPLLHWLTRYFCDECDCNKWEFFSVVDTNWLPKLDYARQLESVLKHQTINSPDHPIVGRLTTSNGYLNELRGIKNPDMQVDLDHLDDWMEIDNGF